jgi:ethanolamine ammonia-lyase large subunit
MPVTLDDLEWCIDQIMPANPAYLMALPTKNDPMLSYLTTGYQDHVRLRAKFGYKVNDAMWDFYKRIKIVDAKDNYTEHVGDPIWVYYQYCLAKGDKRSKDEIYAEGKKHVDTVQARGVDLAIGHGANVWDLNPTLKKRLYGLYEDAKKCLWSEFTTEFIKTIPNPVQIATKSKDREDYVAHPASGEVLSEQAVATLDKLRDSWAGKDPDVQIVISDGLSGNAIMDPGHLEPFLKELKKELREAGFTTDEKIVVVKNGRVRAGYAIGDVLFGKSDPSKPKAILHIIGERPGTEHHSFSVYLSAPKSKVWAEKKCDHDISKVVCNIADTAMKPEAAAKDTVRLLKEMVKM